MKTAEARDLLRWKTNGRIYEVIGFNPGQRAVCMQSLDENLCPLCNKPTGKDSMEIIESSPLFQGNAEPVKTIKS